MKSSITNKTGLRQRIKNIWRRREDLRFWLYRLKWNTYPKMRFVGSFPLHVDIEATDACNLRCIMCVQGTRGVPDAGFIDPKLAYKAIDECADLGVYSIKFNFRGEPLLHPNIVDFVAYAKNKGILEVQFNTNGLPADAKKIESLIKAGLDRIIFSVDGATKETYEKIRVGGSYQKLLSNIDTFLEIKRRENCLKPFIRVQMVKHYGAEKEVDQFIRFWSKKGVDNIAVIDKQDRDGTPILKNGKKPAGRTFCEQPWQRLTINRDGKVLICCGDWDRKVVVGDLNKESIRNIWRSKAYNLCRDKIKKGRLDELASCKSCFRPTTYK